MVRPAVKRLYGLLAMGGFTEAELVELIKHLRQAPPSTILNEVKELQHSLDVPVRGLPLHEGSSISSQGAAQTAMAALEPETLGHIDRLLFTDKRRTKADAVRDLTSVLRRRYPAVVLPVFESKDGFGRWLSAVAQVVPLGEIMHAAAIVGKSAGDGDDWIRS